MFGTAFPTKKCLVLMHVDFVYSLSQKPLIGVHENMETRIIAIHHAMTIPAIAFAIILNFRTEKILR